MSRRRSAGRALAASAGLIGLGLLIGLSGIAAARITLNHLTWECPMSDPEESLADAAEWGLFALAAMEGTQILAAASGDEVRQ